MAKALYQSFTTAESATTKKLLSQHVLFPTWTTILYSKKGEQQFNSTLFNIFQEEAFATTVNEQDLPEYKPSCHLLVLQSTCPPPQCLGTRLMYLYHTQEAIQQTASDPSLPPQTPFPIAAGADQETPAPATTAVQA